MIDAVLLNDTRVDQHHGCSTVIETIDRLSAAHGIRIVARAPAHADWRLNRQVLQAIDAADLVIVNGEGTIHHDRPAAAYLMAAGAHARQRGKAAVLINTTWQANGPALTAQLADFDIVSVREASSAAEVRAAGHACRVIPDLALYCQPPASHKRSGVAYTDSVIGPTALALHRRMAGLGARCISLLHGRREALEFARSVRRYLPGRPAWQSGTVVAALQGAVRDWQSQTPDRAAFLRETAGLQLVVTGRFHMLILALAARTPVLVVASNTHKIEATLRDAGLEPWRLVTVEQIDPALVQRAQQWTARESESLERFVLHGRQGMEALFADIRALVPAQGSQAALPMPAMRAQAHG